MTKVSRSWSIFLAAAFLVAAAGAVQAGTWRVEKDGTGDYTTIQPAVDAAASGDTILIGPGWYQELHWADHYGAPIEVAAYWTDDKDLSFVGTSAEEVTIGPASYLPVRDGPQGIFQEGLFRNHLSVSGISFRNLYIGANSFGSIEIRDCMFEVAEWAVSAAQGDTCRVTGSIFKGGNTACGFISCTYAEVTNCELGAKVYFGETDTGIVRANIGTGKDLASFYRSGGVVEDNTATCTINPCISISNGDEVMIRRNVLIGGGIGVFLIGPESNAVLENNRIENPEIAVIQLADRATVFATGNDFIRGFLTPYLVRCMSYPGGVDPVVISMENNYWGYGYAELIDDKILDFNDDPNLKVLIDYEPFSTLPVPTEKENFGDIKAMFRDATR